MAVLVLLDHDGQTVSQPSRAAIAAAGQLGEVHALLVGENLSALAGQAARIAEVARVLVADTASLAHALAEPLAALMVRLAPGYTHLLAPSTTLGKNVMPRLAAALDIQSLSDICGIVSADTFLRPIYAGNAVAKVQSPQARQVLTVRATSFVPVAAEGGHATIEVLGAGDLPCPVRFVEARKSGGERPDLTAARVVVSGGRGMGSRENFGLLERVADKLQAAIGASRAAVDAGFVPNDYQVGQTGKIVAPELYLGVGISGAIQHLAGMKDSKVIVAINKDEDAPIFQVADYGLVADLFAVLPELEAELDRR
jgi:electron transfer flavoprotein alpha subunit